MEILPAPAGSLRGGAYASCHIEKILLEHAMSGCDPLGKIVPGVKLQRVSV